MHAFDYLHCDIKPANILLTADNHARLCDFGLAITSEEAKKRCTKYGTELYVAPEIMMPGHAYNTKGSDMYALGLTFWSMLHKKDPFEAVGQKSLTIQVKKMSGMPEEIDKKCNRRVAHFFKACWRVDVAKRPSARCGIETLIKARDHKPSVKK